MKNVLATLAVTLVLMGLNTADAADPGQISDSLMTEMGVSGMTTIADHEGDAIRGSGHKGGKGGGFSIPTIVFSAEQFTTLDLKFRQSTTVFIQQSTSLDLSFAQGTRVNFGIFP